MKFLAFYDVDDVFYTLITGEVNRRSEVGRYVGDWSRAQRYQTDEDDEIVEKFLPRSLAEQATLTHLGWSVHASGKLTG